MALPLLPARDIQYAYDWLITNATPEQKYFFQDLLNYIKRYWIETVGPEKFSVYQIRQRSNNPIEAYHRTLRDRIGHHPTIWNFTAGLIRFLSTMNLELQAISMGIKVRRAPEKRYMIQKKILERAWHFYDTRLLNAPKFLSCANHFLNASGNHIKIKAPGEVDHFVYAQVHNIDFPPKGRRIQIAQVHASEGFRFCVNQRINNS